MKASSIISRVDAWEALDSRGRPTVACEVTLSDGSSGTVRVPSGASTGRAEAHELRDGGTRYAGRGVQAAVANVRGELAEAVLAVDACDQPSVDAILRQADGTPDLSRLGANAVLAVSIASALAAANSMRQPLFSLLGSPDVAPVLPLPMVNIVSGGAHAGGAVDIQDFLVIPSGASSVADALEVCERVRRACAQRLSELGHPSWLVADEGGLAARFARNEAVLDLLVDGIHLAGLEPWRDVRIAIDVAASQLTQTGGYRLAAEDRTLTAGELLDEFASWIGRYPIQSIEDPLGDTDWESWKQIDSHWDDHVQVIGDDLFATNEVLLRQGIDDGIANAVLVKPNQNGTLTGAKTVVDVARRAGYRTIVSARSGETEDAWLSDLAIGWAAGQIKVGSTNRSERTAKWNRLLHVEHAFGDTIPFAGSAIFDSR